MSRALLADLSDEQMRTPPCPGVNTLTWLVWHMARVEDIGLNRFVTDGEQVFDGGGWGRRLWGAPPRIRHRLGENAE